MMVGRAVLLRVDKKPAKPGDVTFKVENLTASSDRGVPALKGVSFELHKGEILGIAGVEGNGQSELVEVLAGTRRATGGRVLLGDKDVTTFDARTERDAGIAFIPEDRRGTGLVLNYSVADNLILGRQRTPAFAWRELVLRLVAIREWARRLIKEFDIRTPSIETAARNLSGGNQQKIIVARRWPAGRSCCWPLSRREVSTSARSSSSTGASWPSATKGPQCCSSQPSWTRFARCPTGSRSSTRAGSSASSRRARRKNASAC